MAPSTGRACPEVPVDPVHAIACAREQRWRALAGEGTDPPLALLHELAAQIQGCCGHTALKAHRLAYGWTVLQATERAKVTSEGRRAFTDRSWKEWESGRVVPDDGYRDLLCRLYRTGPVQLGFAVDYSPPVSSVEGRTPPQATEDPVRRRTMLLGGLGMALAVPLGVNLGGDGAEVDRRGRVSPDTADDMRMVAASYRRSYRALPASRLLPAAHGHMEMALALNPADQPTNVRRSLVTVVAEMAALSAALMILDLGRVTDASPYLDLAMRAAKATGDPELQAVVLAGRAFHASRCTDTDSRQRALDFAELACDVAATGASRTTRGWVAAVTSERHAALGDEDECRRMLDQAETALEHAAGDDRRCAGIGAFDGGKLLAYRGGDMVRLGRYDEASPMLDAALERLEPGMHRHRCTALLDRADARLGSADIEGACADAAPALRIAAEVQHGDSLTRAERFARKARASGARCATALWRDVIMVKAENSALMGA